jgi:hypothetical protein
MESMGKYTEGYVVNVKLNKSYVYYDMYKDKIFVSPFEPVNLKIMWPEIMAVSIYLGVL